MRVYSNKSFPPERAKPKYNVGAKFKFLDKTFYPEGTEGELVELLENPLIYGKDTRYKIKLSTGRNIILTLEDIQANAFGIVPEKLTKDYPLAESSYLNCF